jgi:hypothetical protein
MSKDSLLDSPRSSSNSAIDDMNVKSSAMTLPIISRSADSKMIQSKQNQENKFSPRLFQSSPASDIPLSLPIVSVAQQKNSNNENINHSPGKIQNSSNKQQISKQDIIIPQYEFPTWTGNNGDIINNNPNNNNHNTKVEIGNSLLLDYVYGYNGDLIKYCKKNKNIFYLQNDIIIYNIASIVIIMNIKKKKQLFYQAHTDEVTCLTVHPNNVIIASGQNGKDGRILLWDSTKLYTTTKKNSIGNQNRVDNIINDKNIVREIYMLNDCKGVTNLDFSKDGCLLVACGNNDQRIMSIYDWARGELIATTNLGYTDIFQVGFNPYLYISAESDDNSSMASDISSPHNPKHIPPKRKFGADKLDCCYTLVTCGIRHVKFWTLRQVNLENDSNGNDNQQKGGFKGRKLNIPKNKNNNFKFVLEGNYGVFPKKQGNIIPDMTCFQALGTIVNIENDQRRNLLNTPRNNNIILSSSTNYYSRILTGSSTGSIYIWQQLESMPQNGTLVSNNDQSIPFHWLPRGRLLCVVTDVQDGMIHDIDCFIHNKSVNNNQIQHNYTVSTCGGDGILNLWSLNLAHISDDISPMQHLTSMQVSNKAIMCGEPKSIKWNQNGTSIIIGTTGNNICIATNINIPTEISTDLNINTDDIHIDMVVDSHSDKIKRLVAHPFLPLIATICVDKTLRLYSIHNRKQITLTRINHSVCSSLCFSVDGMHIVVGTDDGEILLFTCSYLQEYIDQLNHTKNSNLDYKISDTIKWVLVKRKVICGGKNKNDRGHGNNNKQQRDVRHEIIELKYSRTGDILAVCSRDKTIYLLQTHVRDYISKYFTFITYKTYSNFLLYYLQENSYKRVASCKGHSSAPHRIDFSYDGSLMQSNDGFRETLYWEIPTGKQISNANRIRDVDWNTWSNISSIVLQVSISIDIVILSCALLYYLFLMIRIYVYIESSSSWQ